MKTNKQSDIHFFHFTLMSSRCVNKTETTTKLSPLQLQKTKKPLNKTLAYLKEHDKNRRFGHKIQS